MCFIAFLNWCRSDSGYLNLIAKSSMDSCK